MADGNTPPPDISEVYQTGTVRTAAYQTTGVYETGGAVTANAGQGDAYTVVTSRTALDEAGMGALMDRMQAATAGTERNSTGVIAQIAQIIARNAIVCLAVVVVLERLIAARLLYIRCAIVTGRVRHRLSKRVVDVVFQSVLLPLAQCHLHRVVV